MNKTKLAIFCLIAIACVGATYLIAQPSDQSAATRPAANENTGQASEHMPPPPEQGMSPTGRTRGGMQDRSTRYEQMGAYIGMMGKMKDVCYNPEVAGMVAVGGLKDEVTRKPEEVAKDLEELLTNTKSIGLRNSIRIALKDIYKSQNNSEKVLEHLRAMVAENDAEIQHRVDDWRKSIMKD